MSEPSSYINAVEIRIQPYEIMTKLFRINPIERQRRLTHIVISSPQFAKAFCLFFTDRMNFYEKNFGPLNLTDMVFGKVKKDELSQHNEEQEENENPGKSKGPLAHNKETGPLTNDLTVQPLYVNGVAVFPSMYDITIKYLYKLDEKTPLDDITIQMSPHHAKAYSMLLAKQMNKYEESFGKLNTPKDELDLPYFRKQYGINGE